MSEWREITEEQKDGRQIIIEIHPNIFDVVFFERGEWREGGNFMRLRKEPTHFVSVPSTRLTK